MPPDPWSGFDGLEDEMERDLGDVRTLGTPLDKFLVGQASSSDRIRRPAPRSARAYQDTGRWYPVVVTICPGAISQGISSAKGSRYFSIFRQTFVVRKRGSVSHVEL